MLKRIVFSKLLMLLSVFVSHPAYAGFSVDDWINEKMAPVSATAFEIVFWSVPLFEHEIPFILIWLAAAALFFTLYLNFINLRMFGQAFRLLSIKADKKSGKGDISNFQALATSLSGTVGLGNIAGVAVAISTGGPGAMVWMIVMGFLGMSSKYAECALGIKYRHKDPQGEMSGGPMYYLRDGFGPDRLGPVGLGILSFVGVFLAGAVLYHWLAFQIFIITFGALLVAVTVMFVSGGKSFVHTLVPKTGRALGGLFAICCIGGAIGGGNMFQANQAHKMLVTAMGGEGSFFADKGWLFGVILAVMVGLVIIGGIKSIARVSAKIVPVMAGVYLISGLCVILVNLPQVPGAFAEIFNSAIDPSAIAGGFIGVLIVGVQRAAFSNEAGLGSASIAYAAVKTDSHVEQGIVSMLGPFIDTVVICTMTALVIVISGAYDVGNGVEGVALTARAFESVISWFPHLLAFAVFLFAFSTIIAWEYYGMKSVTYLFGETRRVEMIYKIIYCLCVVVGAAATLGNLIDFSDAMILSMAFPNIVGLYVLARELRKDTRAYTRKLRK